MARPKRRPRPLDWLLVAWVVLLTAAVTVGAVLFLPLRAGAVPVPVSAVVPALVLPWAIRACYRLTGAMRVAFLPGAVWLGISVWLTASRSVDGNPVAVLDWRLLVLLGLGALGAAVGLATVWAEHIQPVPARAESPGEAGTGPGASDADRGCVPAHRRGDTGT